MISITHVFNQLSYHQPASVSSLQLLQSMFSRESVIILHRHCSNFYPLNLMRASALILRCCKEIQSLGLVYSLP